MKNLTLLSFTRQILHHFPTHFLPTTLSALLHPQAAPFLPQAALPLALEEAHSPTLIHFQTLLHPPVAVASLILFQVTHFQATQVFHFPDHLNLP